MENSRWSLAQTAVVHFAQHEQSMQLSANVADEYDYEYVLDCQGTVNQGPLALALSNRMIHLRNRETLALETEFQAHGNTIHEIWTSAADPSRLASCSSDKCVKFWDLRSTQPTMVVPVGHEVWSLSVGLGDTLLVAGTDEMAHFYDIRTGRKLGQYGESHIDAVTKVRFHPTQLPFVVTASEDGVVCFFNCSIPNEDDAIESILNVESAVTNIGFFGPQLENIYCLTGTETLDLWNLQTAQRIHHYSTIRDDCNANGIATDYLVDCLYDAANDSLIALAGDHNGTLNAIEVGAQSQHGRLQLQTSLKGGHKACIRSVHWDRSSGSLYTGGEDARLCRWTVGAAAERLNGQHQVGASRKHGSGHDPAGMKKARHASRPY